VSAATASPPQPHCTTAAAEAGAATVPPQHRAGSEVIDAPQGGWRCNRLCRVAAADAAAASAEPAAAAFAAAAFAEVAAASPWHYAERAVGTARPGRAPCTRRYWEDWVAAARSALTAAKAAAVTAPP